MIATDPFAELAGEPRWVAWRNEKRGDKLAKIPYSPSGGMAKADDPTTWGTRAEAETRAAGLVNEHGGGIGIELGDLGGDSQVCGLDLDACLNQQTCAAWAEAIIAAAPTYGEISPSGTGLKLYFYVAREDVRPFLELIGVLAEQWGCRRAVPGHDGRDHGPAIEVYLSYRYFAVTGRRWPELPDKIVLFDWAALQRLAELVPPPRQTGAASGATGDNSRSAAAFRIACAAKSRGGTYEEMVEQLRRNPETSDWVCEKGGLRRP
jgi:putative DNA primase/helicase